MKSTVWPRMVAVLALLAALSGCAGVYRVDNQVESFARWSGTGGSAGSAEAVPVPPQRYRFERLPSQSSKTAAQSQDALEEWTQGILAPLGWTLAGATEQVAWTVQVAGQSTRLPYAPWESPWSEDRFGWMGQMQLGVGHGHVVWSPFLRLNESPFYQRQVSLVIRDNTSGRLAYETHAAHDGRWSSSPALWQAMLAAALAGFPAPPVGPRQVTLDLPR
jgi:hypothetical protein